LKDELDVKIKEALASIDIRLSSNEVKVINVVDSRLDTHFTRVARDIDLVRAEAVAMSDRDAITINQLKSQLATLERGSQRSEIADSEIAADLRQVEELIWDLKGIPENILITQSQGLYSAIKANNKKYVTSILGRMEKTIAKLTLAETGLGARTIELLSKAVDFTSEIDPINAVTVSALLKQIRVNPESKP